MAKGVHGKMDLTVPSGAVSDSWEEGDDGARSVRGCMKRILRDMSCDQSVMWQALLVV